MRLLVYLVLSSIVVIIGADETHASSWADAPPQVVVNEAFPYASRMYCPTFYQAVKILGDGEYEACVFIGEHLSVANYRVSNQPRVAVKFPYQDRYYRLTGVCEQYWGCAYSDKGDVLVEYQLIDGKAALVVYENARSRLQVNFPLAYGFDASDARVPFQSAVVPKFGLSENGRWLVGELKGHSLGLADLQDNTVHTLTETGNLYGRGFDPQMELAVSNDGQSVVAVGANVGLRLYDVGPDCLSRQACQSTEAGIGGTIPAFRSAHLPRFDESGQLLKLTLLSRADPSRLVILGRTGADMRKEYIALGDSFTSGEGETDERLYDPRTNTSENNCHVSRRSYPYLLRIAPVTTVACAGSTIGDVLDRAMHPDASPGLIAGTRPQVAFVEQFQPHLVTIGIGGNDAGLMAKLKACAAPGTCHWMSFEGLRTTKKEIEVLFDRLVAMYQSLITRSPMTRFIAIGYPLAVDEDGSCDPLTKVLLSIEERRFMNESIARLNRVIAAAAATAGVGFIDVTNGFENHKLCSDSRTPAMNGLLLGNDIAPLTPFPSIKLISSGSFHPTPQGHNMLAETIFSTYGNLQAYSWCEGGKKACPRATAPIEASDYWPPGAASSTYRYTRMIKPHSPSVQQLNIETPGWFKPETEVRVTLHSKPVSLGRYFASESGAVIAKVEIPPQVHDGHHTLMLSGVSADGSPLTLYEEVALQPLPPQGAPQNAAPGNDEPDGSKEEEGQPSYVATKTTLSGPKLVGVAVLGATTQGRASHWAAWEGLLVGVLLALLLYLVLKWRRIAYNDTMATIRTIVKKLIPRTLFKKIEPLGHLFESILMNIRYGFPGRKLRIIGVTGTNGKTTTSFMIHRLLHESGIKVALLTTVANGVGDDIVPQAEHITTAQASKLQRRLRDYARQGVEWVVVETSSHALAQNRVWGLPYEIAVMTNITHEHLDYHGTFKRYVEAKRRLFKIANRHGLRFGVVNAQDPGAEKFTKSVANHTTYGVGEGNLRAEKVKLSAEGSRYQAKIGKDSYDITVNIPGEFNVSNSLAAIAVGRKLGLTKTEIEKGIAALRSVEGRMNVIDEGQPFKVIVDFASTPDAFERLFESIRPLTKGKLIAVFGSAGRRDEAKRPVQGEIAGRSADVVILTEEDDRDIDGNQILQEIAKGAKKAKKKEGKDLFLILNREEAIGFAMTQATSKDDVVVLLGKGHEHTIERADGEYPWNEADVARTALRALLESKG